MSLEKKRSHEKMVISKMIGIYCKGNKHDRKGKKLCSSCSLLEDYSYKRIEKCPYMETKTFCSNCKTHCYKADMREKMRTVMRYSGPRLILHHPILLIKHGYYSRKGKRRIKIMRLERFKIKDIAFLAIMAALLFLTSAVGMPLMTISLFGLRNMAMAIFYGLFATLALMRVAKPGALSLLGFFNGAILIMFSPVMFITMVASAIIAEVIALLIFRSYENKKAVITAAGLMMPLSLPFTVLFSVIMNGDPLSVVLEGDLFIILTSLGTVVLSYLGVILGLKIGKELRKAGKL